jgi:hypothetical protein
LIAKLQEYEKSRDRFPTLWSFLPELFTVFQAKGAAGAQAKPARLPAPAPAGVKGFFTKEFRELVARPEPR